MGTLQKFSNPVMNFGHSPPRVVRDRTSLQHGNLWNQLTHTHARTDFTITYPATKALAVSSTDLGTVHLNEWLIRAPCHCWVAERDRETERNRERET